MTPNKQKHYRRAAKSAPKPRRPAEAKAPLTTAAPVEAAVVEREDDEPEEPEVLEPVAVPVAVPEANPAPDEPVVVETPEGRPLMTTVVELPTLTSKDVRDRLTLSRR